MRTYKENRKLIKKIREYEEQHPTTDVPDKNVLGVFKNQMKTVRRHNPHYDMIKPVPLSVRPTLLNIEPRGQEDMTERNIKTWITYGNRKVFKNKVISPYEEEKRGMTKKYIKKPITVEAEQYTDETILEFTGNEASIDYIGRLCINTLEGIMTCEKGDYVIRGIRGELYPCRQDIFEESYEEIKEESDGKKGMDDSNPHNRRR